ncbi:hypothetical protein [Nannocystis pusilla]|uniref:hypothetical protein n=1 Tax=Nannocystis pusilla TaxID=889268 RepID=UPI003B81D9A9
MWVSTTRINQPDFAKLVNPKNAKGAVKVLTGTHGTKKGQMVPEPKFLVQDEGRWQNTPNVTVEDVTQMTPEELEAAINSAARVICAWCYSERSKGVLKALGRQN